MSVMRSTMTVRELDAKLKGLTRWEKFAVHLPGIDMGHIEAIKVDDYENKLEKRKLALYDKWLRVHPNASWVEVVKALEFIDENSLAGDIDQSNLTPRPAEALSIQVNCKVIVDQRIIEELNNLHDEFTQLTLSLIKKVKQKNVSSQDLIQYIKQQPYIDLSRLQSAVDQETFFEAIQPYYSFLDTSLIVSLASQFQIQPDAKYFMEYKKKVQQFRKEENVRNLRNALAPHLKQPPKDQFVRMQLELEDEWGEKSIWEVETLVKTFAKLPDSDFVRLIEVIPGSVIVCFSVPKCLQIHVTSSCKENLEFMALLGVICVEIKNYDAADSFKPQNEAKIRFSTFGDSLIQAASCNNIKAVSFLLEDLKVSINVQLEHPLLVDNTALVEDLFRTKSDTKSLLEDLNMIYEKLIDGIEVDLKEAVKFEKYKLSDLLEHAKLYVPEQVESMQTFFDIIQTHYNLFNCEPLTSLASLTPFKENAVAYSNRIKIHKGQIKVAFIGSALKKVNNLRRKYDESIQVTVMLEPIWSTCSVSHAELLFERAFTRTNFSLFQWFDVQCDPFSIIFLAPIANSAALVDCCKESIEFLKLAGVINVKIGDNLILIPPMEKQTQHTFDKAVAQAKSSGNEHAVSFLQKVLTERLVTKKVHEADANGNYLFNFDIGSTALMAACSTNNRELINLFLDKKADVNLENRKGLTAIMYACMIGDAKTFKSLLKHNAIVSGINMESKTLLHLTNSKEIAEYLLKECPNMINAQQFDGAIPVHSASYNGNLPVLELLLKQEGVHPDIQDYNGKTPLYVTCYKGNLQIVERLLQEKVDPNKGEKHGYTPLYIACYMGHVEVVKRLLKEDSIDPFKPVAQQGPTPLSIASYMDHSEIVKLLIQKSGEELDTDDESDMAMSDASALSNENTADEFVNSQSAVDSEEDFGTPNAKRKRYT